MGWNDSPIPFDESSDAAAFAHGLFDGFMPHKGPNVDGYPSSRRDPYYYKFAFVVGTLLWMGASVVGAVYGVGVPV